MDHQLAGRRRADDDVVGRRRGQAAAGEVERDGLGRVVGQVGERGDAARDRDVVVPWSGPVPLSSAAVTTVRVVARLQVAVLVLFIDHRLSGERLPGRRRRRRLGVDHQLAGRRRADHDRCWTSPRSGRRW